MSLSSANSSITYTPTVATTTFDFPYPYFASNDIRVTHEDSSGTITEYDDQTGFTVAATNGDVEQGCTVTTSASYTSGDTITVSRDVPLTQEYDLQQGASIDATALNKAFDRTVAQSQQINSEIDRQIGHPVTDPAGLDYEAPAVTNRASKACGWDASGNITALSLATSGTIGVDTGAGLSITPSNIVSVEINTDSLEFDGGTGKIDVKDLGIGTAELAALSVTNAKIANTTIATTKLASPTGADTNVVTGTAGANGQLAGWNADGDAVDSGFDVTDSDSLGASDTTLATQGNIKAYVDAKYSGREILAWCLFDGTLIGTNAPTDGYNVTSVTRNSTGNYTVTFTSNLPNATYCVTTSRERVGGNNGGISYGSQAIGSVLLETWYTTGGGTVTSEDPATISIQIVG